MGCDGSATARGGHARRLGHDQPGEHQRPANRSTAGGQLAHAFALPDRRPPKAAGLHKKRAATRFIPDTGHAAPQRSFLPQALGTILRRWTARSQTPAGAM